MRDFLHGNSREKQSSPCIRFLQVGITPNVSDAPRTTRTQ